MNYSGLRSWIGRHHRLLFYGTWLVLGLMQAGLTELQDDEAYYWVYSRFLDWGYFDHPPMIGLLVKAGYALFPNELGVRFFPLLLNVLSLLIMEKLTERKNPLLFYTICLSIAVLQLSGFLGVPDTPLIFFTALFFLIYKKFAANPSFLHTILLGLCIALLCYSKYHAVLIVLFTLLSNLSLLRQPKAWLAILIALALYTPHLWWQYQHDWVSVRYHLFESNVNAYRFSFTTNYLLGQLLIAGPLAGIILLPAAFMYKPASATEKALRFLLIGIYVFFFLSSFRGKVEANWTSPAIVPLVILSHQFLSEKEKWRTLLWKLLPITLFLVLLVRIFVIVDIAPIGVIKRFYHDWKEWPLEMKKRTQGLPVVFGNSYQRASKYWFYSGQPAYSLNFYKERKNNYNFWPIEDSLLGKPVYFMDKYDLWRFTDSLNTPIGWVGYKYDSAFVSFAKIKIDAGTKRIMMKAGVPVILHCRFEIPEKYKHVIQSDRELKDTTRIGIFNDKGWVKDVLTSISLRQAATEVTIPVSFSPDISTGEYYLRFAINCHDLPPTHNSDKIKLTVY